MISRMHMIRTPALAVGVVGHLLPAAGSKAKDVDLYRIVVPPPAVVTADVAEGATVAGVPARLRGQRG